MKLRTGSNTGLVQLGALPKVIKLTMGNLILPRVSSGNNGISIQRAIRIYLHATHYSRIQGGSQKKDR
jgi:hypothetical protein